MARIGLVGAVGMLLAGCGTRAVPVAPAGGDLVSGLIDVELRDGAAALPGRELDRQTVEDDEFASPFATETDVELEVAPAEEEAVLQALRARPDVVFAEPVGRVEALWLPDDPDFSKQWHLKAAGAPRAWDATRGEGVTVAVIDTGIYPVDDLDPARIVKGWNFVGRNDDARDDHAHGTHVAGTIAQSTGNGKGVAGMAPLARLMPVKVLSAHGMGTTHDIAAGIRFAVDHGARVLNLSLGGGLPSLAMRSAVDYARRHGAVVICAAGNSGGRGVGYPAAFDEAFAVSAVGPQGGPAPYTSYGPQVALAAPGGDKSQGEEGGVLQQTLDDDARPSAYRWFQGTSMATPHVAGAAALLYSLGVTSPGAVERLLASTAATPPVQDAEKYGAGLLDAAAAVFRATFVWGALRLLLAAFGAWFALRHARAVGHTRPSDKTGLAFWGALALGAGGLALLAPFGAERLAPLSFLALPPEGLAARFAGLPGTSLIATVAAYAGWSALVPFMVALPARGAARPLGNPFGSAAAGLAFGWAGALLFAALLRAVYLPWMPSLLVPVWLAVNAVVAWLAGRGLLAREQR